MSKYKVFSTILMSKKENALGAVLIAILILILISAALKLIEQSWGLKLSGFVVLFFLILAVRKWAKWRK